MKPYHFIYAGTGLMVFGLGVVSSGLKPYCVGFLLGSSVGWLIHLLGTWQHAS